MATEHLDAFVQLATSHGLLDENQLKVTEHHVADQAQQLVLATEQKAKARLHDALAEAQSVYVPLLSEEAVQAQVELMRAVLDNLHTLLTEGKDRVVSQLQRPPPSPSITVPFPQQPALVALLHTDTLGVDALHSTPVVFEKPTWGGLMQPWTETCTNIQQHAAMVLQHAEAVRRL